MEKTNTQNSQNTNDTVQAQNNPYKSFSALELLEKVLISSEDSRLSNDYLEENKDLFQEIENRMKINPCQAVFLAITLENCSCREKEFARHLDCSRLSFMSKQKDLDNLVDRSIFDKDMDNCGSTYYVNDNAVEAIQEDKPFPECELVYTEKEFLVKFDRIVFDFRTENINNSYRKFLTKRLYALIEKNKEYTLAKRILELKYEGVKDLPFLAHFCTALIMRNHDKISDFFLETYYGSTFSASESISEMHSGKHDLFKIGYVEYYSEESQIHKNEYKLTEKAKKELGLTPFLVVDSSDDLSDFNLTKSSSIVEKDLFYSPAVTKKVEDLNRILSEHRYKQVLANLKKHNMRPGLACLFYGHPGTGKTETLLQLARRTGRDIMQVDVTQIQDKFVGESEKNIKQVFDDYRQLVQASTKTPILLFNEADAILGKRIEVSHSVDQMNNAIQNIILQELENLEGIFVATTNLTGNLDPAFERRFIYKIQFEKPDVSVRQHIWKALIPELEDKWASTLAHRYDFSGGQIENIARKLYIDNVLWDSAISMELLEKFCNEEYIVSPNKGTIKGFCA